MRNRTSVLVLAATATIFAVAGCGGNSNGSATASPPAPQPTASTSPPAQAAPQDAKVVLNKLTEASVGLTGGVVQNEDTDPNDLLGRPNGYTSRASADLPGGNREGEKYGIDRGLVIEVFPTKDDADRRSKFIQESLKSMPILGTEYHYRTDEGRVLVRVSGKVKPSASKKIEQAVSKL
ncbi:hypothetical protein ACWDUH_05100 [Micromonospora wenchangensis]